MPLYTDQCGRTISLPLVPTRIICLVPSQTELLFHLGLGEAVAGITKFCVHPEEWFHSKTRVGGTKNVNMDIIRQLQPDLIIANKEENNREQMGELARHYPVWISDINSLPDALYMIKTIGQMTSAIEKATSLISKIEEGFNRLLSELKTHEPRPETAYFIWQKPYMAAGGDTFISTMMNCCGFTNIFKECRRYPETTPQELLDKNCQLLLLSSEPFPFKEKHVAELQRQLPATRIMLVDGEMFSWYGSRLQYAPAYFKQLLKQVWQ